MTCTEAETLVLGTDPGGLEVVVTIGASRWRASLILVNDNTDLPMAWPEAPVLSFGDPENEPVLEVTATLSDDEETSTTDSQADWLIDNADDLALLVEFVRARLSVDGEPWFTGAVSCRS